MHFMKKGLIAVFAAALLLWLCPLHSGAAEEGWLSAGQTYQAKAEKGKVLTVKAKTKKGIVCVLLKTGKKDFDWDLTNNSKQGVDPSQYATPEKPTFTLTVDHCDHPEGKIWYSYGKP
jgi:hypothetical protein